MIYSSVIRKDIVKAHNSSPYLVKSDMIKLEFTKAEVKCADEAQMLIKKLGYPPVSCVVKLLQHGGISGININSADVYRSEKIYGESVFGLKGRMSHRKPNKTGNIEYFQSLVDRNQNLKIDIMKLNTHLFVVTVMKPLDLTFTTRIPNLMTRNIKLGLKRLLHLIESRGFNVRSITTDGGFASLKEWTHS